MIFLRAHLAFDDRQYIGRHESLETQPRISKSGNQLLLQKLSDGSNQFICSGPVVHHNESLVRSRWLMPRTTDYGLSSPLIKSNSSSSISAVLLPRLASSILGA